MRPPRNLPEARLVDETLTCAALQNPVPIDKVEPRYPRDFDGGVSSQGEIVVEAIITTEGTVRDPRVVLSDNPRLIDPVLLAVKQWKYKPAMCDGAPVEMVIHIYTRFWVP
jgi:TonB family protein